MRSTATGFSITTWEEQNGARCCKLSSKALAYVSSTPADLARVVLRSRARVDVTDRRRL